MKTKPKAGMARRRAPITESPLDQAVASARASLFYLLTEVKRQGLTGICHVCGCTDEHGCERPCVWADARKTLCSNCTELASFVDGLRAAARPAARK